MFALADLYLARGEDALARAVVCDFDDLVFDVFTARSKSVQDVCAASSVFSYLHVAEGKDKEMLLNGYVERCQEYRSLIDDE